jgi:hypothetical protein
MPTVNAEIFPLALQQFAQAVGANKHKQIVLVLDRAGWHTSKALTVPEGLHLALLASLFSRVAACRTPVAVDQ